MTKSFQTALPDDSLVKTLRRIMGEQGAQLVPVMEGERIVGIVTPQNLSQSMGLLNQSRRMKRTEEAWPVTARRPRINADETRTEAEKRAKPLAPGLYLVATPIGNLEDITLRALRVLRSVDKIACEDTRQTQKLLNHFDIRTPTVSYHMHNEAGRATELAAALKAGARIAVVSDAGTPGIADPGGQIAAAAIAAGVPVFPIPGANAAISALIASGLAGPRASPSTAFFPPKRASAAPPSKP